LEPGGDHQEKKTNFSTVEVAPTRKKGREQRWPVKRKKKPRVQKSFRNLLKKACGLNGKERGKMPGRGCTEEAQKKIRKGSRDGGGGEGSGCASPWPPAPGLSVLN